MPEYHIVLTAAYNGGYVTANVTVIPRPDSTRQSLLGVALVE